MGSSLSEIVELLSDVVQGSGVRPLQFLAFINKLAEILERAGVYVKLFVDDVKLYINITNSCDADKLQHALNVLVHSAQRTVSVNKCCKWANRDTLTVTSTSTVPGFHALRHVVTWVSLRQRT